MAALLGIQCLVLPGANVAGCFRVVVALHSDHLDRFHCVMSVSCIRHSHATLNILVL